jgi:putative intracellular protease/amidase
MAGLLPLFVAIGIIVFLGVWIHRLKRETRRILSRGDEVDQMKKNFISHVSHELKAPLAWRNVRREDFDGLLLPGGHRARGMREYLESEILQKLVSEFFAAGLPVAAICHGVLLAARSHATDGRHSVLFGRRTTALTWALERKGWTAGRILRFWDPNYYRTYEDGPGKPAGYMSVQQEVARALARPEDFLDVPADAPDYRRKTGGMVRDTWDDDRAAFVVRDGDYVSARWPGDAHTFARRFAEVLAERCSR